MKISHIRCEDKIGRYHTQIVKIRCEDIFTTHSKCNLVNFLSYICYCFCAKVFIKHTLLGLMEMKNLISCVQNFCNFCDLLKLTNKILHDKHSTLLLFFYCFSMVKTKAVLLLVSFNKYIRYGNIWWTAAFGIVLGWWISKRKESCRSIWAGPICWEHCS